MILAPKSNADVPCQAPLLRGVLATCAVMMVAGGSAAAADDAARLRPAEYSVINLGPGLTQGFLNERGQAVIEFFNIDGSDGIRFFDGTHLVPIATLGGNPTIVWGLNKSGVVVGASVDTSQPVPVNRAFMWTPGGGTRTLSGPIGSSANAVNDRNQVVGWVYGDLGINGRAVRWNADGTLSTLGPLPSSGSAAYDINAGGTSTGTFDSHAVVWSPTGTVVDLGTVNGESSVGLYINANGEVAGLRASTGFFWSRKLGVVPFTALANTAQTVQGLNDKGEVAGQNNTAGPHGDLHFAPFLWSAKQGMRNLPLPGFANGVVYALNNKSEMVGSGNEIDTGNRHAVFWRGVSNPVDLTSRLYRAPAGLVLYSGQAINDKGDIVADSNAGAVLLRPGRQGTAAPVLGPISSPIFDAGGGTVGGTADFTVGFVDSNPNESHVASASVSDGCPQAAPTLKEVRGTGEVSFRHTFCQTGFFDIAVKVTDRAGNATEVRTPIFVYEPSVATLSGQGALSGATAGAPRSDKRALRFTLWAPLAAPSANRADGKSSASGLVQLTGPFTFDGRVAVQPVRGERSVHLEGTGRLNGRQGYRFTVDASPGNDNLGIAPRMALRISHTDPGTKAEVVDFDNGAASTPNLAEAASRISGTQVTWGHVRVTEPAPAR